MTYMKEDEEAWELKKKCTRTSKKTAATDNHELIDDESAEVHNVSSG